MLTFRAVWFWWLWLRCAALLLNSSLIPKSACVFTLFYPYYELIKTGTCVVKIKTNVNCFLYNTQFYTIPLPNDYI